MLGEFAVEARRFLGIVVDRRLRRLRVPAVLGVPARLDRPVGKLAVPRLYRGGHQAFRSTLLGQVAFLTGLWLWRGLLVLVLVLVLVLMLVLVLVLEGVRRTGSPPLNLGFSRVQARNLLLLLLLLLLLQWLLRV
jgi:hypothetical protein